MRRVVSQELKTEMSALAMENAELIKICQQGVRAIESMGSKCNVLETNINTKNEEIKLLKDKHKLLVATHRQEKQAVQTKLDYANSAKKDLQSEITTLKARIVEMKADETALRAGKKNKTKSKKNMEFDVSSSSSSSSSYFSSYDESSKKKIKRRSKKNTREMERDAKVLKSNPN